MATLMGYRCDICSTLFLPPTRYCPKCDGHQRQEVSLSGRGQVRSWTTIRVAPSRYQQEAPYIVVIVDLEEGVRLMGRLVNGVEPERDAPVLISELDPQRGPLFRLA